MHGALGNQHLKAVLVIGDIVNLFQRLSQLSKENYLILLRYQIFSKMPKSAEEILQEELDIDMDDEEKEWRDEYMNEEYGDILEFYTDEEREFLDYVHTDKQYNLFGEEVDAYREDDEVDEQKLKKFVKRAIRQGEQSVLGDYFDITSPQEDDYIQTFWNNKALEEKKHKKKRKRKRKSFYGGYYQNWTSIQMSKRVIKITKKAFHKIRQIAEEQDLYLSAECAGFLYGKNDIITKVKKYVCTASAGLVTGNPMDVFNQAKKKKYMGLFHSHLFNSSSMSGTDKEVLVGWTSYSNMCKRPEPIMIIARSPRWKMKAWSMNKELQTLENELVVI